MDVGVMQCSAMISSTRVPRPCYKTACVMRDGALYCRMHDPVNRAEKANRRGAREASRWETAKARVRRLEALRIAERLVVDCALAAFEEIPSRNAYHELKIATKELRRLRDLSWAAWGQANRQEPG